MNVRTVRYEVPRGHWVECQLVYVTTLAELDACVAWCRTQRAIGLDIETDGLSPDGLNWRSKKIATIQVGNPHAGMLWVLCVRTLLALDSTALAPLLAVLADPSVMKVGQNIAFEIAFLCNKFGGRIRNVADCQIAELVLRAGLFESLKKQRTNDEGQSRKPYAETSMEKLCHRYLGLKIDKGPGVRLSFWSTPAGKLTERHLVYAAGDVVYPFFLAQAQRPELRTRDLQQIVALEFELIPVLVESELYGVQLDQPQWRALWREAVAEQALAKAQLDDMFRSLSVQQDLFANQAVLRPTRGRRTKQARKSMTELNYDAPDDVKRAIVGWCTQHQWPVEPIISTARLHKLKKQYGATWLDKRPDKKPKDVPDWVIPEDKYVVLLKLDADVLRLAKIRGQLPGDLVDTYLTYKGAAKRAGTYGNAFLEQHLTYDGAMHSQFHQALAATGRVSSTPNCYDATTEILTDRGWVAFPDLTEGTAVAQYVPDTQAISFVQPSRIIRHSYTGPMVEFSSQQVSLLVTPEHRMLVQGREHPFRGGPVGAWRVIPAGEWGHPDAHHYHAGWYSGGTGPLSPDQLRLLVAIQAEGYLCKNSAQVEFGLVKARKQERLLALLRELGVPVRVAERLGSDLRRYRIWTKDIPWVALLGANKEFGPWLLEQSRDALDAFVDELWYWDGCSTRRNQYSSSARTNADWAQVVLTLSGTAAKLRPYAATSGTTNWIVDVRRKAYSCTSRMQTRQVSYAGMVYCVTVPSGFVVVRRKGADDRWKVSVSGNCQNIPRDARYRACFRSRPGYRFCTADYSQIEPRLSAELSQDPVYVQAFVDGADLYLRIAEAMLGKPAEFMEQEDGTRKLTKEWKVFRQIFKTIVLMLAYRGGAWKLRDALTLALEDEITAGTVPLPTYEYAHELHSRFFDLHHGIRTFQEACTALADVESPARPKLTDTYINDGITWVAGPCGRKRFFGSKQAKLVYTGAPNAPIQGSSATITKYAMVLLQRVIDQEGWDAHLVLNVHDELVYEVREDQAQAFAPVLKHWMEVAGQTYIHTVPVIAAYPEGTDGVTECWMKEAA